MKANELVFDYWVEVVSNDHLKYVQIAEIYKSSILTKESEFESEEVNIKPVPLTPKILEKNGWKSYSRENTPIYGMVQGFEIVLAWMNYYWQLCVDGIIYRKIKIINVHELQCALKLCRIEKTIKL